MHINILVGVELLPLGKLKKLRKTILHKHTKWLFTKWYLLYNDVLVILLLILIASFLHCLLSLHAPVFIFIDLISLLLLFRHVHRGRSNVCFMPRRNCCNCIVACCTASGFDLNAVSAWLTMLGIAICQQGQHWGALDPCSCDQP